MSRLEIRYWGFPETDSWTIFIVTTDGQKGDGIPGRHPFMERLERIIRIAHREYEDELQRKVFEETLKLIFPTVCCFGCLNFQIHALNALKE